MIGIRSVSCAVVFASLVSLASAQLTQRVSVSSSGVIGNGSSSQASLSADGRYVGFESFSNNLVPGDTNGETDSFVRDRQTSVTERVSVSTGGTEGDDDSRFVSVSGDARWVAFGSRATNLVAGDTNGVFDIFVRDRQLGTTERISVDSGGGQANGQSLYPAISPDGRFVVFQSEATNLVAGDTNATTDVFLHDRQSGLTERVSVDSAGVEGDSSSHRPAISDDGRYVAFASGADNLVVGDTNPDYDVFVRDRQSGTTERVSIASDGSGGNSASSILFPLDISADGRFVVFDSVATNLVAGDTNGGADVFLRDRLSGTTERVSISTSGEQSNDGCQSPAISADGRYVAFEAVATNWGFLTYEIFLRDRQLATTERISVTFASVGDSSKHAASLSADGSCVAFQSHSTTLVPGDTNFASDAFVRDRFGAPNFASTCDPGVGGVLACPCANPPSGLGRGCDNSSNTGGASLSAAGGTFLSSDTLVFTTSGEKPTALSIVGQWNVASANGVVFGMGVRCASGLLKRLYTKSASGGSITAPSFGAGDLQVSARSAALGGTIQPGQSRWYLVYYRDPIVLGGCPAASTFNATQTGEVLWAP